MLLRQVRTDSGRGDVSVDSDLGDWERDLLHLERRVVQQLLQLCVARLIGGYGNIAQ